MKEYDYFRKKTHLGDEEVELPEDEDFDDIRETEIQRAVRVE